MNPLRHWLFWLVLALVVALGAQMLMQDPGYVLVRYHGYDYSTTLARAVPWLLGGLLALALVWTLVSMPFAAWRNRRERLRRARLTEGLDALERGDWSTAEKTLLRAAEDEEVAGLARVNAARAAASRGDAALARQHLDALSDAHAATRAVAIGELALAHNRPDEALAALDAPAAQPLPGRGLALRAQALAALGRAGDAYGLLGALRKQQAWPEAQFDRHEREWARASLLSAGEPNLLAERWDALPKSLRREPAIAEAYARSAAAQGWDEAATRSLEDALDTHWDEPLADLYTRLPLGREDARRNALTRWHAAHPRSPALALGLARLTPAHAWPESERQLREAIALGAGAPAWEALADGYAASGDDARARIAYANALRAARDEPVLEVPPMAVPTHTTVELRDTQGVPRLSS